MSRNARQCTQRRRRDKNPDAVGASGSSAPNPRSRRISKLPIIYIMLTRPESDLLRAGAAGRPRHSEIPGSPRIDAVDPACHPASGSSPARRRTELCRRTATRPAGARTGSSRRSTRRAFSRSCIGAVLQRRAHYNDSRFADAALRQRRVVVACVLRAADRADDAHTGGARSSRPPGCRDHRSPLLASSTFDG